MSQSAKLSSPFFVVAGSSERELLFNLSASYIGHAPLSLAIREVNRLIALRKLASDLGPLKGPILDVGCGDGFWWQLLDRANLPIYGVDISPSEIRQASRVFNQVECLDITKRAPFSGKKFAEVIGNCSLEHIRDIDMALQNLRAAADANCRFVLFVPTAHWALQGHFVKALGRMSPRLSMMYSGTLNGFFQHWHLYHYRIWTNILAQNGWDVQKVYGLGGVRTEFLFRLFLPPAFIAFIFKSIFRIYPNRILGFLPKFFLRPFAKILTWGLQDAIVNPDSDEAYEYMIVAKPRTD